MYAIEGFQANVASIYKLAAPFVTEKIRTAEDLRAPYREFIKDFYKNPAINESANLFVEDPELARAMLSKIAGSRLNDLDQEEMVGELLSPEIVSQSKADIENALFFIQQNQPELYNLFRIAIHSIAISKSKRNRLGQRAHGGTSNGLTGLMWFALEEPLEQVDLVEMLVHELTHTLVFIDEFYYGHFNYENLTKHDYWAQSAILGRPRPMDKVVHSIAVSIEVLSARKSFLGESENRRVHPSTEKMIEQTKDAIASVLGHPLIDQVCLPRSLEIVRKCGKILETL